ncbi:polysaccharide pyruvyl transferase family protein [Streptococcus sp. FT1-106]|uniref:polysaccharide pyruvyl transferase family protein n=1 Tax=Streptococcus sp. FT1-106 TaxID=3409994 RepID=UPI003BF56DF5
MKKIFLKGYLKNNLGDDLFVKIITERYPDNKFYSIGQGKYNFSNLMLIDSAKAKIFSGFTKLFSLNKFSFELLLRKYCDAMLLLGGSMFIEGKSRYDNQLFKEGNYYVLGSNFGPYKSNNYYNEVHSIFSRATDVCLRDRASYDLFNDISNVRMGSDIVFSMPVEKYIPKTKDKRVVFSVINPVIKLDEEVSKNYKTNIINCIHFFKREGYDITLMSFCDFEGDRDFIDEVSGILPNNYIDKYYYDGNIDEALKIFGKSEIIVASRFHASIIGLIMDKTIIPFVYSDKTLNVLEDMHFMGKILDIRDNEIIDFNQLFNNNLNYKISISEQINSAYSHFKKLDEYLGL